MKVCIVVACLALASVANTLDIEFEWINYKNKYGKAYEDKQEDMMRMNLYAHKKAHVERHNKYNLASYKIGLNHLSDWTEDELKALYSFKLSSRHLVRNEPYARKFINEILANNTQIPDSFDWRKVPNRVTEVKDQGQCGSSWAFATTGLLEGKELQLNKTVQNLIQLSEQNLIDCQKTNQGCDGGSAIDALAFVQKQGGINEELSYPYEAEVKQCRFKRDNVILTVNGGAWFARGNETTLKRFVYIYGPVAVAVDATGEDFQLYKSGVYYNANCRSNLEKGELTTELLVVGYGTDPEGGDYWIVKNSWGPNWGDKGYIKMARNRDNNCGIATAATIAIYYPK